MNFVNYLRQTFFSEPETTEEVKKTTGLTKRGNVCDYCQMNVEDNCPLHNKVKRSTFALEFNKEVYDPTRVRTVFYERGGEFFLVTRIQGVWTLAYIGDRFDYISGGDYEDYVERHAQQMYSLYLNMSKCDKSRMSYLKYKSLLAKHGALFK